MLRMCPKNLTGQENAHILALNEENVPVTKVVGVQGRGNHQSTGSFHEPRISHHIKFNLTVQCQDSSGRLGLLQTSYKLN